MSPTRLIVHGLGRVGSQVHRLAQTDNAIEVVARIAASHPDATHRSLSELDLSTADALIDFSTGESVAKIVQQAAAQNPDLRIIIGSSGWDKWQNEIRRQTETYHLSLLYGANFSIATAFFAEIVRYAADLFGQIQGYDTALLDIHHRGKTDMPSGTALHLAEQVKAGIKEKTSNLIGTADRAINQEEVHIAALRLGQNKGFHQVWFDSAEDTLTLSQQTHDRTTYASGALTALHWLIDQANPGFYTFDQVLSDYFAHARRTS